MRFKFFDAEKILAEEMVNRINAQLPPNILAQQSKILSVNKITKILEEVYQTARSRQENGRISFIQRAVLANNFKWGLKNNGYSQEFIDMATEGLIFELSK